MNLSNVIGLWGALTGTAGLLWQWRTHGLQVAVTAETRATPFSEGLSVTIRNRGGKPTTIEKIEILSFEQNRETKYRHNLAGCFRDTIKLPAKLQPGESWEGHALVCIDDDSEETQLWRAWVKDPQLGLAHCLVQLSHRRRPVRVRIEDER